MAKPISQMGADISARVERIAIAVERSAVDSLRAASNGAKAEHMAVMRSDSGGDGVLSNVGARKGKAGGRKISAAYRVTKDSDGANASIMARGPVPLIANPIKGHVIRSAYQTGGLRTDRKVGSQTFGPALGRMGLSKGTTSGRAVINIPGIGYRRSARHPGTKGKDTWNRAKPKAQAVIDRELGRRTDRVVTSAFRRGS